MERHEENSGVLTTRQAAAFLSVSEGTLRKWVMKGDGPPYLRIGSGRGQIRYRRESIDNYLLAVEKKGE